MESAKRSVKGQGDLWFWITALIGVVFVITVYIVFDTVLFASEDSLQAALIPLGLNTSAQPMVTLHNMWGLWAPAFILAWALALIIRSIVREPTGLG